MLKVCYFGIYNPKHTRNQNLINGLKDNNVEVVECNIRGKSLLISYWILFKKHRSIKKDYQVMMVGFPGQLVLPLAWLLSKFYKKKLVLDAFISLYDSLILDQKLYKKNSFQARKYWLMDWLSCRLPDIVLMETEEYIKYYVETFGAKRKRFKRILVGSDEAVIYPRVVDKDVSSFLVHFHGTYLPIQGIPYIIKAAKILENENIIFNLIGKLSTYSEAIKLAKKLNLKNVNFIDFVPYQKLAEYIAEADVCLGMFGNREKALRCGAFKIVEAMAMKKPVITADTPAIRELLTNRQTALLCKIADEKDLAAKILELKSNPALRNKIAENGYQLFRQKLTQSVLGRELKGIAEDLLKE